MKKFGILLFVLIAALVFGGCDLFKKAGQTTPTGGEVSQPQTGAEGEGFVGKLKDAMALGTAMKCTYKHGSDSGTSYIKGDKVYTEFLIEGETGYMVMKDNCMYTWGTMQPEGVQGIKMCFEPAEFQEMVENNMGEGQTVSGPPPNVDYNCTPAVIGDDKFSLPSNINFMDLQQMMQFGQ